jgi:hypothetical protein
VGLKHSLIKVNPSRKTTKHAKVVDVFADAGSGFGVWPLIRESRAEHVRLSTILLGAVFNRKLSGGTEAALKKPVVLGCDRNVLIGAAVMLLSYPKRRGCHDILAVTHEAARHGILYIYRSIYTDPWPEPCERNRGKNDLHDCQRIYCQRRLPFNVQRGAERSRFGNGIFVWAARL